MKQIIFPWVFKVKYDFPCNDFDREFYIDANGNRLFEEGQPRWEDLGVIDNKGCAVLTKKSSFSEEQKEMLRTNNGNLKEVPNGN